MARFEIIGSGVGSPEALPLPRQAAILKRYGARNVRKGCAYGWRNQPETLFFSAPDFDTAERIARRLDAANNPLERLGGGGGLLRAYPARKR